MFGVDNKVLFKELEKAKTVALFNPAVSRHIKISKAEMKRVAKEQIVDSWHITKFRGGAISVSKGG